MDSLDDCFDVYNNKITYVYILIDELSLPDNISLPVQPESHYLHKIAQNYPQKYVKITQNPA